MDYGEQLARLKGLELWGYGRAADMAMFLFGAKRIVQDFKGKEKEVGELSLHVQCEWNLTRNGQVIAGSNDRFYDSTGKLQGAAPDSQQTLLDLRMKELFANGSSYPVRGISPVQGGSFALHLEGNITLSVFVADSLAHEQWRLFRPASDDPHFVFGDSDA